MTYIKPPKQDNRKKQKSHRLYSGRRKRRSNKSKRKKHVSFSPSLTFLEVGPSEGFFLQSRLSDFSDRGLDKFRFCDCKGGCEPGSGPPCLCQTSEIKCWAEGGRGCACKGSSCSNIFGRSMFDEKSVAKHSFSVLHRKKKVILTRSKTAKRKTKL